MTETLYDISEALVAVLEDGMKVDYDTGEIIFDEDDLDALQISLDKKLDGTVSWIRSQENLVEYIKAEEKRLSERRKSLERALDRYREYVMRNVKKLPSERLSTPHNTISIRHSKSVEVLDEGSIPKEFMAVKTTAKPDKKAIKSALQQGIDVPGAAIVINETLSVR